MLPIIKFEDKPWDWKVHKLYDMIYCSPITYHKDFFYSSNIKIIVKTISESLFEIAQTKNIYPVMEDCFRALKMNNPKGIIIGMDPYHNQGSAVGLCFSLPINSTYINPSFRSIQKEVANNGFQVNSNSANLCNWHNQGIMLLNTALTVEESNPGSHIELWSKFTEYFLEYITNKYNNMVIFMWGKDAQSYYNNIKGTHFIIKTSHPMPLSAYKSFNGNLAFIGSNCFRKANDFFKSKNNTQINWEII